MSRIADKIADIASIPSKVDESGGTMTGDLTVPSVVVSGTVDGRDVSADGAKLDTVESGATGDQTDAEILAAVKRVDGAGSGLDADLLDGIQGSSYALKSDVAGGFVLVEEKVITTGTGTTAS